MASMVKHMPNSTNASAALLIETTENPLQNFKSLDQIVRNLINLCGGLEKTHHEGTFLDLLNNAQMSQYNMRPLNQISISNESCNGMSSVASKLDLILEHFNLMDCKCATSITVPTTLEETAYLIEALKEYKYTLDPTKLGVKGLLND